MCVSNESDKIIEQNANIMKAWFEFWFVSHVPKIYDKTFFFFLYLWKSIRHLLVGGMLCDSFSRY